MRNVNKIAIIGAGFAGVASARILTAFGYEVTVFEKEPDIGGVWASSRRYPQLATQNPKDTYCFSEMPMPRDYPEWPEGAQVQAYIDSYARRFSIHECIRFESEVVRAVVDEHSGRWTLDIKKLTSNADAEHYSFETDYLVVCNGVFSTPFIPPFQGVEAFRAAGGRVLHTSEFHNATEIRGKNVIIVGYGKSSCDVAAACANAGANITALVARDIIWKIPKRFFGWLNFKHLVLNRFGEGLFKYIRLQGLEKFLHSPFGNPIRRAAFASFEALISWQFNLKKLDLKPKKSFETIGNSTISLVSEGFYEAVGNGSISVYANSEIVELRPGAAVLSTGETIAADTVVCGTGWRQEVPFLAQDVLERILDEEGNFRLYRSILPMEVPNIAFNGYGSSLMCQLNCEIGALWMAYSLKNGLPKLEKAEINESITQRLDWMSARTNGKHCKGANLIPFTIHHIDELLDDMSLSLPLATRIKQWFLVADPTDYRNLLSKSLGRFGVESPKS